MLREALELMAFVLPAVVGWLADDHRATAAVLTVYWGLHQAGVQQAYRRWLHAQ